MAASKVSIPVTVQCIGVMDDGTRCPKMTSKTRYCPEHLASVWGVEVKESEVEGAGDGLFAVRDFEKGNNIVPYLGRIIIVMRYDDSSDEDSDNGESVSGPYVVQMKKDHYVDAARTDSEGRYANAAPKGKQNNAQIVYDSRNRRVWIRARVNIPAGTEIRTAYGKSYWQGKKKS